MTHGDWLEETERLAKEQELVELKSTQERQPWHATARTMLQAAGALAALLPVIITVLVESVGEYLPEGWVTVLLGISAGIVAVTGLVARIMQIPGVNDWLRTYAPIFGPGEK